MGNLKRFLLALTPMGAAAVLDGGRTFDSLAELLRWAGGDGAPHTTSAGAARRATRTGNLLSTKKVLLAMMLIGALAYFGGSGTWASFSAETSNSGSSIATGTLTLSDQVGTTQACLSTTADTHNNVNGRCTAIFNLTNVAPGVFGGTAKMTLQNTGSIDASQFYLAAPYSNATLSSSTGTTSTSSLAITALEGTVITGDPITVSYGTYSQTFTASATAYGGATSISINAATPIYNFPANSSVTDTASNVTSISTPFSVSRSMTLSGAGNTSGATSITVASVPSYIPAGAQITIGGAGTETVTAQSAVSTSGTTTPIALTSGLVSSHSAGAAVTWQTTDCSDTTTPTTGTNPTHGADLNFISTAGDPLCHHLDMSIQETTNGNNYCWTGYGSSPENANGLCTMPISTTINGALTTGSPTASLPVTSMNGVVQSGDQIVVSDGTHSQTFTASANVVPTTSSTTIAINSATPSYTFSGATVTDTTSLGTLNSDTTDTIANFDTTHPVSTGKVVLYQPTGAGTDTLSGTTSVGATTLNLGTALTTGISSGSQIRIGGANAETVTTTQQASAGANTLTVTATTSSHANADSISFAGINNNSLVSQLPKYGSGTYTRTFWVSVYLYAPAGTNQNVLQGLQSTFGLLWHIDQ